MAFPIKPVYPLRKRSSLLSADIAVKMGFFLEVDGSDADAVDG
jgi:hypothetical protein